MLNGIGTPTPERAIPLVRSHDLADASRLVGSHFELVTPLMAADDPALSGHYRLMRLRPGLFLHTSDTVELHDLTTRIEQRPGVTLHLFLDGRVDARLGGRPLLPDERRTAPPGQPQALIVARAGPEMFERRSTRGAHIRKVNLTLSPDWIEETGSASAAAGDRRRMIEFARSHLATCAWTPGPSLLALAGQILRQPSYAGLLQSLYLESRALEVVGDAFAVLAKESVRSCAGLRPGDRRRLQRIEDYLEAHSHEVGSLDQVAAAAGVSVSSLQRLFQAAHGTTVFDHVRRRNLERARLELERDGLPVGEVAYRAGYRSAANFSTAFKRCFGVSPRDVRRN